MLVPALICAVCYEVFGLFDYQLGTLYGFRPIVVCPVVGLLLGNPATGLALGASLELLFLGSVSIGAYVPPDATSAGVLCTAYVILLGIEPDVAIGLAMPIGTLVLAVGNLIQPIMNSLYTLAPKFARQGEDKKIVAVHWACGLVSVPFNFVLIFCAVYFGSAAVAWIIDVVPSFILDGFSVAANILPVMGFAMLCRMIITKELVPFFFLGFLLTAYANIPVLGVVLFAIILAIEKLDLFGHDKQPAMALEGDDDDDF